MIIKILQGIVKGCANTLNAVVGGNGSDRAVRQVHREKVKYQRRLDREIEKRGGKK